MKILLAILAILLVGGSFLADFYWRRWMAQRRQEHDRDRRS
ncbi:MAG TPA: hypothetical protein VMD29_07750 [Terracidiphilus sp.]|nr:hypothetical protein [Terracidiphilus sp.]